LAKVADLSAIVLIAPTSKKMKRERWLLMPS
jgi:hypothetical protein